MNKKRFKHILASCSVCCGIAATAPLLTSCGDDWLSLSDPNLETADTFWKTADQFNEGLTAAYSTWRRPG